MNYFQRIENKNEWQGLLSRVLFKTFFHDLEWEEFLEKIFKWLKFKHYLYKDEVLLSLARYKIFGKERLISHPFCEYGGPLPLKENIDGLEFKRGLLSNFKASFKISFHPALPKYFKNLGLKEPESERDTYLIENFNLKTDDELLKSFRKTTRNEIKKAQTTTLLIENCRNENDLRAFYKLYLKNAKRHKTLPYPLFFLKYFLNSQNSEIILAKYEKKIIAGSTFLFYGDCVHYFLNASEEKYKNLRPNHLILWHKMRESLGKNFQIFDLGGTKRGSSLEIFKKGWAAQRYPIFELKNYPKETFKESKLRNIFGILPSFLIKRFNSYLLKYKL